MTPHVVRVAAAIARTWVGIYTARMPGALREDRRAEIEADLWHQQQDESARSVPPVRVALHILLRMLLGFPDDVAWRFEASGDSDGSTLDPGRLTMSVSPRHMRWLGLSALAGGTLSAGSTLVSELLGNPGRVYTSETSWHLEGPMAIIGPIVGVLMLALWIGGIIGLYVAHRHNAGRAGAAGFMLLAGAFVMAMAALLLSVLVPLEGAFYIVFNLLIVPPSEVMIPLGFLLLGIGLPRPIRRLPFALGIFLTIDSLLGFIALAVRASWPAAPMFYRSDSPLGVASGVLMGLAVAGIGYSMWTSGRAKPPMASPV